MNRIIIIPLLFLCFSGFAQSTQSLSIGINNTQFAFIGYEYNNEWSVIIENSLFVSKLAAQYVRVGGGYSHLWEQIRMQANILPYVGINYAGSFYDFGLRMSLSKNLGIHSIFHAELIPCFDSGKGYRTCYVGSISQDLIKEVSVIIKATNFPEFRNPEQRISTGLNFNTKTLSVNPELSVPIKGDIRTSRILISFVYYLTFAGK